MLVDEVSDRDSEHTMYDRLQSDTVFHCDSYAKRPEKSSATPSPEQGTIIDHGTGDTNWHQCSGSNPHGPDTDPRISCRSNLRQKGAHCSKRRFMIKTGISRAVSTVSTVVWSRSEQHQRIHVMGWSHGGDTCGLRTLCKTQER